MYLITNGKEYLMRNPLKQNFFLKTTHLPSATEFTYNQANQIMQSKKQKMRQLTKGMQIVDVRTGQTETARKSKENIYTDEKGIEYNDEIVNEILEESDKILELMAYDKSQLNTYKGMLNSWLGKYDSAESDVLHGLEAYRKEHDNKKPPAHKMSKIAYILDDIRDVRRKIKKSILCVDVMIEAIENGANFTRMQNKLESIKSSDYKGRSEYFSMVKEILE